MKQTLQNELSKKIHPKIVQELLKEYEAVCKDFYLEDNKGILASSGRFVDMVLAGIQYWHNFTLLNLNTINFDSLCNKIIGLPKRKKDSEEDLLLLEIPNVARAIYTIRNKKRGAHRKDFDPITQDRIFLKNSVDWIMASLLFVFHTRSDKEIQGIIETLIQKEVPLMEEFEDGGMMILKKVTFIQKLLIILYKQNKIITKKELKELSKPKRPQDFNTNFNNLKKRLLIYVNGENVKINQNGIKEIEEKILKEK